MADALETTVNWPEVDWSEENSQYTSTGEGGLTVYAVWDAYLNAPTVLPEATLKMTEVFVKAYGPSADRISRVIWDMRASDERELILSAVIPLGATSTSIFNEWTGEYWSADRHDLTDTGLELLTSLEKLIGAEATLLTLLDT